MHLLFDQGHQTFCTLKRLITEFSGKLQDIGNLCSPLLDTDMPQNKVGSEPPLNVQGVFWRLFNDHLRL